MGDCKTRFEQVLEAVKEWPKHAGKADYLKFLNGVRITQGQAIKAKCYECCCGEPSVCNVSCCPLTPYSQHKNEKESSVEPCTPPESKKESG